MVEISTVFVLSTEANIFVDVCNISISLEMKNTCAHLERYFTCKSERYDYSVSLLRNRRRYQRHHASPDERNCTAKSACRMRFTALYQRPTTLM